MKYYSKNKLKQKSAFTLVELLISMSIVALMATLSVSSYPKFSEQIGLTGETYKMLAYMRETQTYGISALAKPGVKFVNGFVLSNDGTIKRLRWECPTTNCESINRKYVDNLAVDPTEEVYTIKDVYKISLICGGSAADCTTNQDKAYGIFRRPNPEARLITQLGTIISPDESSGNLGRIEITLQSKRNPDFLKKIVILQTGQMYVSDW